MQIDHSIERESSKLEFLDMLRSIAKVGGYGDDWKGDLAVQMYFFPLSYILFTAEEFEGFMFGATDIDPEKFDDVCRMTTDRLYDLVKEADLPSIVGDTYLSVIVYGVDKGTEPGTLRVDLTYTPGGDETFTACRYQWSKDFGKTWTKVK